MKRPPLKDVIWRCIGCGNEADLAGETRCDCPSGLLFRRSDMETMTRPRLIDEEIGRAEQRIVDLKEERMETLERIRAAKDAQ